MKKIIVISMKDKYGQYYPIMASQSVDALLDDLRKWHDEHAEDNEWDLSAGPLATAVGLINFDPSKLFDTDAGGIMEGRSNAL